jgi:hypothetical protein
MTQWLEVDNWLDLVGNAWIGLVLIAVAAVPSFYARRNHATLTDVKAQVVNGHGHTATNMRDDIDRAIRGIDNLAGDVRALKADLMYEEERRRSAIEELYDELDHRTGRHRRE